MSIIRETEVVNINELKKHPDNYKIHNEKQLKHIIASIKQNGIYKNIVISEDNVILAGHGVTEALTLMGERKVPVIRVNLHSEDSQAKKLLVGDNEIGNLAGIDDKLLQDIMLDINESNTLIGTGFDMTELNELENKINETLSMELGLETDGEKYTRKVETPIYQMTGDKPFLDDVFDKRKTRELMAKIQDSSVSEEFKAFLYNAAQRHTAFNYKLIAEYYAHSTKEEQELMEDSALVVVDFDKAVEHGFVKLTGGIRDAYENEKQ